MSRPKRKPFIVVEGVPNWVVMSALLFAIAITITRGC